METTVLLLSLGAVGAFIIGMPILLIMGLWCIGISFSIDLSLANLGATLFEGINFYGLLAMPLFVLTGDLISGAGIARRLTDFSHACLGWVRGGLAISTVGACGIFAAISGSNAATAATIGYIMYPEMRKDGYDPRFAAATVAAGGTVGIIIPPSIVFITYGFIMNQSITDLFLAGLVPGLLMIASMLVVCYCCSRANRWGTITAFVPRKVLATGARAYLGFSAIFLIMYGIYTGAFSPTESAAACVFFCLLAGIAITRELHWRNVPTLIFNSGKIVGMLVPLLGMSMVMQQCLSALGVDRFLQSLLEGTGYIMVMSLCMACIFIAGMFLESVPIVTILAPLLAPVAVSAGADPIHFGVVFLVGAAIGFITPPFGLNLFVAASVASLQYTQMLRYASYHMLALLVAWGLIAIFPEISLFILPR